MPLSTEDAVRETYRLALEGNLKKQLKTQGEWDRYLSITSTAAERMDAENDSFRDHYQDRLIRAEEIVMREQTGRMLDHPKPTWADDALPSSDRIEIVAHNRVLADHETRQWIIRTDQIDAYKTLRDDCRTRAQQERAQSTEQDSQSFTQRKGQARDAFATTQKSSPFEAQSRGRSGPSQS